MSLALPTGRNLVILPRQRALRQGIYGASLGPAWPAKDPAETNVYAADFMWVFGSAPTHVLAEIWPSGAAQLLEQTVIGTCFVARIAGGADGQPALVLLTAISADGRVEPRVIALPIAQDLRLGDPSSNLPIGDPSVETLLGDPSSAGELGDPSSTQSIGDP